MNKPCVRLMLALLIVTSTSAFAANRAVEVAIFGIGPGVDMAALKTLRQVIGMSVANGVADKFMVTGNGSIPIEGGFSACVEAAPTTREFGAFVQQLRTIRPNPRTTGYSVRPIPSCPTEPVVFCTQDVKICPDGSFVGRVPPSCAFAPCPTVVNPR
jgi:hypothetical protein